MTSNRGMTVKQRMQKIEKDKKERERVFRELCIHLSAGKSLDCFSELSATAIKDYMKRFPEEFCEDQLQKALRQGRDWWEQTGVKQAEGKCIGNSRTWYYNMANRYGWRDKIEVEAQHKGEVAVNVISYASTKSPSTSESKQLT